MLASNRLFPLANFVVCNLVLTDPHPGNIFVMEDGRIGLIDFGQVKQISGRVRETLCKIMIALADRQSDDNPEDLEKHDVVGQGREVRYHSHFAPAGTNVNFVALLGKRAMAIRTYERGVEDETLACGTGATAVAVVGAVEGIVEAPVDVHTRSGETLTIYFDAGGELPETVYMEGEATVIYQGRVWEETG